MPREIAYGRLVAAAVAIALLATTAYFGLHGWREYCIVEAAWATREIDAPIDLSRPGTTRVPYVQSFSRSHIDVFFVEHSPCLHERLGERGLLGDLQGTLTIRDLDGNEVHSMPIPGPGSGSTPPSSVWLASIVPVPEDRYELTIDVSQGAPALAGREQRLVLRHRLCGAEYLGAIGSGLIAALIGVPTLILSLVVFVLFLRFGLSPRKRRPQSQSAAEVNMENLREMAN